jgi:hypothetical protein
MADEEGARTGHRCLIDYSRAMVPWGSKGSLLEEDGILLCAGGSWIPVVGNCAFRTDDDVAPGDLIERADAFFGGRGRGYSVKVRDTGEDDDLVAACEMSGLVAFGEPVPQMITHQKLEGNGPPDGIALRAVVDEPGAADFAAVNTDAYATYGMPAEVFADLFDRPERLVADAGAHIGVAYRDGLPVATALTYLSGGVASLQWIGTVSTARHVNLGRVVTEWATNLSFDLGATSVTLQASPMGAPLYAKLGYETLYLYREYVRWSATGAPPSAADR